MGGRNMSYLNKYKVSRIFEEEEFNNFISRVISIKREISIPTKIDKDIIFPIIESLVSILDLIKTKIDITFKFQDKTRDILEFRENIINLMLNLGYLKAAINNSSEELIKYYSIEVNRLIEGL